MAREKTVSRRIWDYIIITLASLIYATGLALFLDPNNLAPGGFSGIAIIISRFTSISTGTWFLIFNIPVMILGMWKFGWKFIVSTIYSIVIISLATNAMAGFGPATQDPLLAATAGGSLIAIGVGLIFRVGATTGGTDIIVKFLRLKYRHLRTGVIFLLTDAIIVTASGIAFGKIDTALYAGIAVIVCSIVMDIVLYGRDEAKLIYIISDKADLIAGRLMQELDVGATFLKGSGAYSNQNKKIIMCAMKKQVAPKAEEVVKEMDPDSFMIVTSASEVFGEGHKSYFSEKL
ncbi:MAG: YitT family protein [Lachnospiraceae bacterium]|nr:YitT family protein [Lachnospiraceae bacterium]MDD3659169.1 YitT family protein [Lachnospiraceae bacterium]